MSKTDLITLSKTHFLYVVVILLVVLPVLVAIAVYGDRLSGLWCMQFEIPEYERQFGFRMGDVQAPDGEGGTFTAWAVAWVDPNGVMGRAGVRPGDVPTRHHGGFDFCTSLARIAERQPTRIEMTNVVEHEPGSWESRWVNVPAAPSSAQDQ